MYKYSWFLSRYYDNHGQEHDEWFWIDSDCSLLDLEHPKLSLVGEAYDKPWHLEEFRPNVVD